MTGVLPSACLMSVWRSLCTPCLAGAAVLVQVDLGLNLLQSWSRGEFVSGLRQTCADALPGSLVWPQDVATFLLRLLLMLFLSMCGRPKARLFLSLRSPQMLCLTFCLFVPAVVLTPASFCTGLHGVLPDCASCGIDIY